MRDKLWKKWKQTWRANINHGSCRRCSLSTIQAIFQGTDWCSFPKVLMFACIPQTFPPGLFVCLNWSEAFRISSALSQDKAKSQCDRLGLYLHFSVTNTKTFSRNSTQSHFIMCNQSCSVAHPLIMVHKEWRTLFVLCGPSCTHKKLLSYHFLFAPYISIIVYLGHIMQSNFIFLFTMRLE